MMSTDRIHLSPPHMTAREREALLRAFDTNWIAPLGPAVDAFEAAVAEYLGGTVSCAAVSSGTAALHLSLLLEGVEPGDEVWLPTFTFVACANAVSYVGARPVFFDVDPETWLLDLDLIEEELRRRRSHGSPTPRVLIPVQIYGQCIDPFRLRSLAETYGIRIVEDAAEALGSVRSNVPAGTMGSMAALSFNGNKLITTGGGGMVVCEDADTAARVRKLAAQSRERCLHYEHHEIGYNYRLNNLLAAIGNAQLTRIEEMIRHREEITSRYDAELGGLGLRFLAVSPKTRSNRWLSCALLPRGVEPERFCRFLDDRKIEARPVWKPMHLQKAYGGAEVVGGQVSEELFARGVCLPNGSGMGEECVERVLMAVRSCCV